jgi:uncharacterized protein (DUF2235 family)
MMGALGARNESQGWERTRAAVNNFFKLAGEFKATFSRCCRPHFVGAWDTVSSVGWISNPLHLPNTASNPDITIGRHAVSIDECRAYFRQNLWVPSSKPDDKGPKDLLQVWFPGSHGDVGGGYPEAESGLSKVALAWMLGEARVHGLRICPTKEQLILGLVGGTQYVPADPKAILHDQLKGWWIIPEFLPKRHFEKRLVGLETKWVAGWRINLFRRRWIPPKSYVHDAAYCRGPDYVRRLPDDAIRVT